MAQSVCKTFAFTAMGRYSSVLLLTLAVIGLPCLPLSLAVATCTPGMAMTCMLPKLNMLTDGYTTLRNIPPATYYSVRVEMLHLPISPSGAFLTRMSEFFSKLELYVYHDPVFQIPPGTYLSSIQVLEAPSMKQLLVGAGDNNVTELIIYTCGLERIPQTIGNLPLLEDLTFTECALRNFSLGAFGQNRRLRVLDLSRNQIETIIPTAREMPQAIEYLYLSSNRLENLDMAAFIGLPSLSMIDLRNNNLAKIASEQTVTWSTMEMLDVSYNRLRTIDLQWLSAPNLKRLILSNNLFEKLPERLRRFPKLQLLGMGDNRLAGVIDLAPLNGLPELNSVDLSNNPTVKVLRSSRPIRLPVLDSLYAEYCSLNRFNTSGIDLPVVSFISLAHNNFTAVAPLGQAFPSIQSFSFYDNPIPCSVLKARAELILSGKLIMGIPPLSASECASGSIQISPSLLLCCKA
ncbi:receptor-like protein Cf-9 [Anopheles merus]|uniref:receptor-like protein Cf-9 n=1 Tax=Anopheles merus TaxID=30066 RepID=UPI001BE3FFEB|nr:receptor-like protein Cf-9 [Anopheles merus]